LEEVNEPEPEKILTAEEIRKFGEAVVANLHRQAEEAINERVYNMPLSFDTPRVEYRPPPTCANLYCQTPVAEAQNYCAYHQ